MRDQQAMPPPMISARFTLVLLAVTALFVASAVTLATAATAATIVATPPPLQVLREQLAAALAAEDAALIQRTTADINQQFGKKAGVADVRDKHLPIPTKATWLSAAEVASGLAPSLSQLEKRRWWKIGLDPRTLGHPLREPATVVAGNVAAARAKLGGAERSLAFAKDAGDFLLWAQVQAGTGGFPFPASRGVSSSAPFVAAERQLQRAEKQGRLGEMVRNGWAIRDDGDGGLQFDNGECGVALFELYEATRDRRYLNGAKQSADWAMAQPLVVNWNYNSFSVFLLARAYRVTGVEAYRQAATRKALLGVIPGQLRSGPNLGRWGDPHNARPSYHYIMLRGLVELVAVLPTSEPDRLHVLNALRAGLITRNREILTQGAPNKDKAMETLLMVNRIFANDRVFLEETLSADALDALAKLVSAQARRGSIPLGPREWGHFLEYVAWKGKR